MSTIKTDLGAITAYAIAVKNGFTGTESEWLASLVGATGLTGPQGPAGSDATVTQTSIETALGYTPASKSATNSLYGLLVQKATSTDEIDELFVSWWNDVWQEGTSTRLSMLEEWFGEVLTSSHTYGVKLPLFATSNSADGEYTLDSVGLTCEPSTGTTAGTDDFAHTPEFWCVEVSGERNTDGSITIYYVQHIDSIDDVRSGEHLCWVAQKNTYWREYASEGYHHVELQSKEGSTADGWHQWPQGTTTDGVTHSFITNPKYYAGKDANGLPTCGTGLAPLIHTSFSQGVTLWRTRGSQYSGASGSLIKFLDIMMKLKYHKKGNSGTIEGCSSYNKSAKAAVSETDVERIVVSTTDAANFKVGSWVQLATNTNRNNSTSTNNLVYLAKIKSSEEVTIDDTTYTAINIDNGGTTFSTTASATYIVTMPYGSGYNDGVLGYDGSLTDVTGGTEPGLLQKIEFQSGAYLVLSDELWNRVNTTDSETSTTTYTLECYTCHDQSKVSTSITSDYTKHESLTLTIPNINTWVWIEDTAIYPDDPAILWPAKVS